MEKKEKEMVIMREQELMSMESFFKRYEDCEDSYQLVQSLKEMSEADILHDEGPLMFQLEKADESDLDEFGKLYDPEVPFWWDYIPGKSYKVTKFYSKFPLGYVYKK